MITEERCPSCHIAAGHIESRIERLSVDEILGYSDGMHFRVTRVWVMCCTCGHVWPIATWANILDPAQLAAFLHTQTVIQQLPKDAPG